MLHSSSLTGGAVKTPAPGEVWTISPFLRPLQRGLLLLTVENVLASPALAITSAACSGVSPDTLGTAPGPATQPPAQHQRSYQARQPPRPPSFPHHNHTSPLQASSLAPLVRAGQPRRDDRIGPPPK
jgi:hypothetical protein